MDLAHEAVEIQGPLAETSGVTITLEVEPDVQTTWGDRRRLLQVFENLIRNALKFTPAGGRIVVRAAVKNEDVEAHGGRIGMESEVGRGTTFFFTIPASRRSAGDGNGLVAPSRDERAQVASTPAAASAEL